jgi:hypothetical protein
MPRAIGTALVGLGLTIASTFAPALGLSQHSQRIGFAAGIALIVAGAVLFVSHRKKGELPPMVNLSFGPPTHGDDVPVTRIRESYGPRPDYPASGGTIAASAVGPTEQWEEARNASFVWATVVNDRPASGEGLTAEDVRCYVSFSSPTTVWLMKEIKGRWRDADNPLSAPELFSPFKTHTSAEAITIPPDGEPRSLDVAFKFPDDDFAYAYNNESYYHGNDWCRNPKYRVPVLEFIAAVRVTGSNFAPLEHRYIVSHEGKGSTIRIREMTQDESQ